MRPVPRGLAAIQSDPNSRAAARSLVRPAGRTASPASVAQPRPTDRYAARIPQRRQTRRSVEMPSARDSRLPPQSTAPATLSAIRSAACRTRAAASVTRGRYAGSAAPTGWPPDRPAQSHPRCRSAERLRGCLAVGPPAARGSQNRGRRNSDSPKSGGSVDQNRCPRSGRPLTDPEPQRRSPTRPLGPSIRKPDPPTPSETKQQS
jgi:hypothetical protein